MLTQDVLEHYFDRLLQAPSASIDPNHPLAEDGVREECMTQFQTHCAEAAAKLAQFSRAVDGKYSASSTRARVLSEALSRHALKSAQSFSEQLRECAVYSVLDEASNPQAVSERYFSTQGVPPNLWNELVADIASVAEAQKKWFSFSKVDGMTVEEMTQIVALLMSLEEEFVALHQGVLSHDKRMLEMLRLLKNAMKGQMVAMAAEHTLASKVGKGASFARMASILNQEMQVRDQKKTQDEQEQVRAAQQIDTVTKDRGRGV